MNFVKKLLKSFFLLFLFNLFVLNFNSPVLAKGPGNSDFELNSAEVSGLGSVNGLAEIKSLDNVSGFRESGFNANGLGENYLDASIKGQENASDDFDDVFSDDNMLVGDFLDHSHFSLSKKEPTPPKDIVELLIDIVHLDKLLQEDLFLRTNPLVKRSLLDNNLLLKDKNYTSGRFVFSADLFFEQTSRMHFTAPCASEDRKQTNQTASCIKSYMALTSPTLMCKLKDLVQEIREKFFPDFNVDCEKGISLIKNATAQERSVGFFFDLECKIKKFNIRLKTPFYYKERNLYLTAREQEAIACEFGESDADEGMAFARKHLISDQLGLGDLRFEFDYPVATGKRDLELRLGLFTTIPTAVSVVKGMLGEVFKPVKCRPTVNFIELFDMAQSAATRQQAMDIASDLSLSALDNISAMLLDSSLGNNGHFGLGTRFHNNLPFRSIFDKAFFENINLRGHLSFEYMFPHKENRWFVDKDDPALFAMRDFKDESKAVENLAFLEKMTINRIFPFVYETTVRPGCIFILEEKLAYEKKKWGMHIGSDIWVQTREQFGQICAPKDKIPMLDIEKARMPWASQWSIFGSVFFKPKKKVGDLYIGLNGEKVISSRGIGQPFKISLSLERNF